MDKKEPCKEFSEDVTRESLIAISYRLPETERISEQSPKKLDNEKVAQPLKHDGDEKYRSKLMSISSSQSPDMKILPVLDG